MADDHDLESGRGRGVLPRHIAAALHHHADDCHPKLDGDARSYVVGHGKATGYEHLFAYDLDAEKEICRHSDGEPERVGIPETLACAGADAHRRIVIHHNHPNGSSLSAADLRLFDYFPGIATIFAHGHDGIAYRVTILQRGNIGRALRQVQGVVTDWHRSNALVAPATRLDGAWITTHVLCLILQAADMIDYRFRKVAERRKGYEFATLAADLLVSRSAAELRNSLGSRR
ncbi:hypothetical protein [Azospirillum sp.]|uniref:hypothetical protein n=1 Tax=Azospirillum sp. TaxID=34012 RepID=UPI002D26791F|nr:hypothetical protein [Azospirillum sp.]HYF87389.1 hypothetical protein [Azospirillum sp.]